MMETPIKHVPRAEFLANTKMHYGSVNKLIKVADFLREHDEKAYSVEQLANKFGVRPNYIKAVKEFRKYGLVVSVRRYKDEFYICVLDKIDPEKNKKLKEILEGSQDEKEAEAEKEFEVSD